MDINLAATFLEIVSCRSFAAAAQRLHLTQTAVSARIRHLEELLGQPVFVRNKSGACVTPAGKRFMPYALSLVQVWERARLQVAVPTGRRGVITAGCEPSLWDPLLVEWLVWMRAEAADIAVGAEIGPAVDLLDRVANGSLDVAIVYAPQHRPGLMIEFLLEEKLVLVSTDGMLTEPSPSDYIYVDWGREFGELHAIAFPELSAGGVSTNLGPLARDYLLAAGGCGYFRQKVVRSHLESGRLFRVPGAPEFPYPAYAVYAHHAKMGMLAPAIAGLKHVAGPHRKAVRASRKPRGSI